MTRIVGFSEGYHDAGITLLDNKNILHASHSERYSKKKTTLLKKDLFYSEITREKIYDKIQKTFFQNFDFSHIKENRKNGCDIINIIHNNKIIEE